MNILFSGLFGLALYAVVVRMEHDGMLPEELLAYSRLFVISGTVGWYRLISPSRR